MDGREGEKGDGEQNGEMRSVGDITTTGPVITSLTRQQRSHSTFRLAGFGSLLVQLTDTTILQFLLEENWCFQRSLDEKMNGKGRRGQERMVGPEEEYRERMSPF